MSKTKAKRTRQGYRKSWETSPILKDWIQGVPDKPDKAYCKFCKCLLYAHRYSVLKHTCTIKHQQNVDIFKGKSKSINIPKKPLLEDKTDNREIHTVEKSSTPPKSIIQEYETDILEEEMETEYLTFESVNVDDIVPEANQTDTICLSSDDITVIEDDSESSFGNEEKKREFPEKPPQQSKTMSQRKQTISTHILDTSKGNAAANIPVTLYKLIDNDWKEISQSATNSDGRCSELISDESFTPGCYKLHFYVKTYFKENSTKHFYPFIEIVFECEEGQHYHVPLLLNPYGYSTYRGT